MKAYYLVLTIPALVITEFELPETISDVLRKFQLLMPSPLAVLSKDILALKDSLFYLKDTAIGRFDKSYFLS